MIHSRLHGKAHFDGDVTPFAIGDLDPTKGFVHVFDDKSLDIVMNALTTVYDFVAYLMKKESFLRHGAIVNAAGEEELLAFYLRDVDDKGEHDFIVPSMYDGISIAEGMWDDFSTSAPRAAQLAADEVSYVWDQIIEKFAGHILGGTSIGSESRTASENEQAVRWLAKEGRTVRRLLAMSLLDLVRRTPNRPGIRATRIVPPPRPGSPYYTFLVTGTFPGISEEQYREFRRGLLKAQCMVAKLQFPDLEDIVGFATEPRDLATRSEDVMYLNAREWTPELETEAKELQAKLGLLTQLRETFRETIYEYPTQANG